MPRVSRDGVAGDASWFETRKMRSSHQEAVAAGPRLDSRSPADTVPRALTTLQRRPDPTMDSLPPHMRPERSFQGLILTLQRYWADYGCVILQPYDMEVGAGTFHPATTLRALGPKPWNAAYVQPSRRPKDGRYGENPNRLQHYYQFQVILKPSPPDLQELYLKSLAAIGIDSQSARHPLCRGRLGKPDARRLGAGLGMLVRRHGSVAVHLLPAGRGRRMRAGRRRTHLRAGAARLLCAGRRPRLDLNFNGRDGAEKVTLWRRVPAGRAGIFAAQFRILPTPTMLFEQFRMAEAGLQEISRGRLEETAATQRSI